MRETRAGRPTDFSLTVSPSRDVLDDLRLRVRIALIRAGRVRHDRGVKLLAKFAAQLGNAALGVFGELLCGGAILNGVDRFARVILEVACRTLSSFFSISRTLACWSFFPSAARRRFLALQFLLASAQAQTLGFRLAQFGVELVEELATSWVCVPMRDRAVSMM